MCGCGLVALSWLGFHGRGLLAGGVWFCGRGFVRWAGWGWLLVVGWWASCLLGRSGAPARAVFGFVWVSAGMEWTGLDF